ncbi:MAG TPA: glycosyltransferase family 39 protein [Tepidisphaeraceae bacterium]|nr:glycosyltransferase family 39 protein [Tepidisphaeraceae bacterium]
MKPTVPARRGVLAVCAIGLLLLLPFINKPFHSDDPFFLWPAIGILKHPANFYSDSINWEGREQHFSDFCQNPPLTSYAIAAVASLAGFSERALHLSFLVFNLSTIVGVYLLAQHFGCRRPALAVVLMLLAPAVLVSMTSIMCEPVFLCFWTWSVLLWEWGSSSRRPWLLPLAGVAIAAAILSKYLCVCLLPLLIAHAILRPAPGWRTRLFQFLSMLIPAAALAVYEWYCVRLYGHGLFTAAMRFGAQIHEAVKIPKPLAALDTLAFLGGGFFSVALINCFAVRPRMRWLCVLAIPLIALLAAHYVRPPRGWTGAPPIPGGANVIDASDPSAPISTGRWYYIEYGLLGAAGLLILVACVQWLLFHVKSSRDDATENWRADLFLLLWIGGIIVFAAFINWSINARTLVPMAPALCILVVRMIDGLSKRALRVVQLSLIAAAVLAIAATAADYRVATACRDAADQIDAFFAPRPDQTIWFAGHSGWQYYMQQHGARPLVQYATDVRPGDIVVYPVHHFGASPGGHGFQYIRTFTIPHPGYVATMQTDLGAEFYCSFGQGLPFIIGPVQPESFIALRATPATRIER